MTITYHRELVQGTEEWLQLRIGLLTASEMKLIVTPGKLQYASNDKQRSHLFEIAAQRITDYCEPSYISDDMLRGQYEELEARELYDKKYSITETCGFVTNDKWGFVLGYSPDALVGTDGLIECKSRKQKYQVQTIMEGVVPDEFMLQIQTGLLVTERAWLDFVSYSGGLPMFVRRVLPDAKIQAAIINAATAFHEQLGAVIAKYRLAANEFHMTERKEYGDIITGSIGASDADAKALAEFDRDAVGAREAFMFGKVPNKEYGL